MSGTVQERFKRAHFGRWNWGRPRSLSELSLIVWQCFCYCVMTIIFIYGYLLPSEKKRKAALDFTLCCFSLFGFYFGGQPSGWVLQFTARLRQLSTGGVNVTLAQWTALCLWKGCFFFFYFDLVWHVCVTLHVRYKMILTVCFMTACCVSFHCSYLKRPCFFLAQLAEKL